MNEYERLSLYIFIKTYILFLRIADVVLRYILYSSAVNVSKENYAVKEDLSPDVNPHESGDVRQARK